MLAEALKLGFADRDAYYGDPLFEDVPLEALLSDRYTELRRSLIDMEHASEEIRPGDPRGMRALQPGGEYRPGPGGTTTCVVADRWGNLVAATPSANLPSGGGATGVAHGNRLRSLNTTDGHPNRIKPGKRPRITLTPTLVLKNGKPVMAVSVSGGDLQDQTTLNLLLDVIEFGMMPADAVTAPRFATRHHENSFNPNPARTETVSRLNALVVNDTVPPNVRDALAARGHEVTTRARALSLPVMIYIDQTTGILYAAGDPNAGRHAAAID